MNSLLLRFLSGTICIATLSGCLSTKGAKTEMDEIKPVAKSKYAGNNNNIPLGVLARLNEGPLNQEEAERFFLFAETFAQFNQFAEAEKCLVAVYSTTPTLVVGIKLARVQAMLGNIDQAEKVIRKTALLFPKSPEPILALSFLAWQKGEKKDAEQILETALNSHAASEELIARYIEVLLESNQRVKARKVTENALQKKPTAPWLLYKLAQMHAEEKNYIEANKLLDRLFPLAPDSIEGLVLAGHIAQEEKNWPKAEDFFRAAYDKQPDNDLIAQYYVRALLQQKKYQQAKRHLLKLEQSSTTPLDIGLIFQLGVVLFETEDFAEARLRFLKVDEKAPEPGLGWFMAGQCDEALKDWEQAKIHYEKVSKESDYFGTAQQRLFLVALEQNRKADARSLLEVISQEKALTVQSTRFIAMGWSKLRDYAQATALINRGLKQFSNSPDLHYLSAALLEFTKSREESITALKTVVKKYPDHVTALNHLGYTLAERGQELNFAISLLQKVIKKEPNNGGYLDSYAWALYKVGRLAEARKLLLKAMQLDKEEPVILEHMGHVSLALKDKAAALGYFERSEAIYLSMPSWKVESEIEWATSYERVKQQIKALRNSAIPSLEGE